MDEEKLPPPVGRSAGRGALIKKLLAEQQHARTNSSSSGSVNDSGVSISTAGGAISMSSGGSGGGRGAIGRGIIAKLLNASSSSSNDDTTNSVSINTREMQTDYIDKHNLIYYFFRYTKVLSIKYLKIFNFHLYFC